MVMRELSNLAYQYLYKRQNKATRFKRVLEKVVESRNNLSTLYKIFDRIVEKLVEMMLFRKSVGCK